MKLSEAIRLGAMSTPQAFNRMYDYETQGTCAIGAALFAIGDGSLIGMSSQKAQLYFPALEKYVKSPGPSGYQGASMNLCAIIINLNDSMRWTREQIADFVERCEVVWEKEEKPVAEEVTCEA